MYKNAWLNQRALLVSLYKVNSTLNKFNTKVNNHLGNI